MLPHYAPNAIWQRRELSFWVSFQGSSQLGGTKEGHREIRGALNTSDDLYRADPVTPGARGLFILHLLCIPSLRAGPKEAARRFPGHNGNPKPVPTSLRALQNPQH